MAEIIGSVIVLVVVLLWGALPLFTFLAVNRVGKRLSDWQGASHRDAKVLREAVDEQRKLLDRLLDPSAHRESPAETTVVPSEAVAELSPPVAPAAPTVVQAVDTQADPIASPPLSVPSESMPALSAVAEASAPPRPVPAAARQTPPFYLPPPMEPSRFEKAAQEILGRIWNWIAVGEEHRPQGVSIEFAVASTWLLRVGVLILLAGVGFFFKYSIDHAWLGPAARVGLALAGGMALVAAGVRLLGGMYHILAQGLIGAGLGTLYFALFASYQFYHLVGPLPAGAAMVAVTIAAAVMAVRFESLLIAILGLAGGYATPLMLSGGPVNFSGLYGYLLLLALGVLVVSQIRDWRLLLYLSFAGTYALVLMSLDQYRASDFAEVMPWLVALFVVFSTGVFIFQIAHGTPATLLEVMALLVNAAVFFAVGYALIDQAYGHRAVAVLSLGLASFYTAHVGFMQTRGIRDRGLSVCFLGLAALFLAVSVPILLSHKWIGPSWSIQAAVMLWIAGKLPSRFLRQVSYILYGIVIVGFCLFDLPSNYLLEASDAHVPLTSYLLALVERLALLGTPVASLGVAWWLLRNETLDRDVPSDMPAWFDEQPTAGWMLAAGGAAAVALIHLELNRTVGYLFEPLRLTSLTLWWVAIGGALLVAYRRRHSPVLLTLFAWCLMAVVGKLLLFDLSSWSQLHGVYGHSGGYSPLDATIRLFDFGALIALLGFAAITLSGTADDEELARTVSGAAALGLLFLFLTLETNSFLAAYVPGLRAGGVSILWTLFALGCLLGGIRADIRPLRFVALALFAVVSGKVFLSDLALLDPLYRIVALLILSVLVLTGSFLYLKYRQTFATSDSSSDRAE